MRIFDLKDPDGRVFAFEVSSLMLGRRGVPRVVRTVPGAVVKAFHGMREEFCEFELDGVLFVAWEPWNDSSRFWIGTRPPRWVPQLEPVRQAFECARPIFGFLIG
jgi:hypothetical protein